MDIQPGSIYDYLGIENGDVIKAIDGEPIRNLNEVMKLFGNVANLKTMNLTVGRNGSNILGSATNLTVSTNGAAFTLVYVNATRGWAYKDNI